MAGNEQQFAYRGIGVQILEGVRVLDLTRAIPGEFCTMILADLGAEVIKIEPVPSTESTPVEATISLTPQDQTRVMLYALNRNKGSVGLNLKTEEGKNIFRQLSKRADVLVEGFRPGVVKRLGVDYDTLTKENPRLIYCSISGYGQSGRYMELAGHDINYISMAGLLDLIRDDEGKPVIPLNLIADYAGGALYGVISILAALLGREQTSYGQHIDVSMADGALSLLTAVACNYFAPEEAPYFGARIHCGIRPACYRTYRTGDDRYISVGCVETKFWKALCHLVGRCDFIAYQFAGDEKQKEMVSFFESLFLTRSSHEWLEALAAHDIPVARVNTLAEALSDQHFRQRGMIWEFDDPVLGKVRQIGSPIKLSGTSSRIKRVAPVLGDSTVDVLCTLGYSQEQVRELRQRGIIW